MKKIQILTDESIEKIKRAIKCLQDIDDSWPTEKQAEVIADLEAIIADVES